MLATLIIIGLVLLLGLQWVIVNYNRMARLRQHIRESWSDIDVELRRRYELIPNLVETVKGYAEHERQTLEQVITLRNKAVANTGPAVAQAADESVLLLALKRLFVLAERYPQLRADAHFLALQAELANTEDRIAAARRFYNGNIREMTQLCETVPTNLLASMFGFVGGDYFELDGAAERVVPRVQL
ncbi:MAG: LemA family protein [Planctomycetes bacterium]|nr:LemA family protein [Planctomycetota bacterium]